MIPQDAKRRFRHRCTKRPRSKRLLFEQLEPRLLLAAGTEHPLADWEFAAESAPQSGIVDNPPLVSPYSLSIKPTQPTTGDSIILTVSGLWNNGCGPTGSSHRISGRSIEIDIHADYPPLTFCTLAFTPFSLEVPIGSLSPGTYQVVVGSQPIGSFTVVSTWQNPDNSHDVNGDGVVFPIDALILINELNNRTVVREDGRLPDRSDHPDTPFWDTSGDGFLTPLDVLIVINTLNRDDNAPCSDCPDFLLHPINFENFNNGDSWQPPPSPKWEYSGPQGSPSDGVTVTVSDAQSVSGSKSLHFDDQTSGFQYQVFGSLSEQATHVQLDFYMRTENADYEAAFVGLRGDVGSDVFAAFGNESGGAGVKGYIGILQDSGWVDSKFLAYEVGTWYHVRRTLSTDTGTGTLYVAEVLPDGTDSPTNRNEITIGSYAANTFVNKVHIWTSGSQRADAYIDDIQVRVVP